MKHLTLITIIMATLLSCQNSSTESKQDASVVHESMKLGVFEIIELQQPDQTCRKSLMEAMHLRKSSREFEQRNLSLKHLSDILWVANGINREDGKRTVPSARALYPIKTYAVLENGIYFYNPEKHRIEPVVEGDYRNLTGLQEFVYNAPLNILFIADYNIYIEKQMPEDRWLYLASLDAAHSNQNIYLYCASEGIRTVERAGAKEDELIKVLNLDNNHKFIVAQTVGY